MTNEQGSALGLQSRAASKFYLLAACAFSTAASAEPGEHIRAGEAVITPKIALGVEHSTNVYHADEDTRGGTNLWVAPALEIGASGSEFDFAFLGSYELRKYFQPDIVNLDRYNDFQLGGRFNALKESPVGFTLSENMGMRNYPAEAEFSDNPYETLFRNDLGSALLIRPGGALEGSVGGFWVFDDVQVPEGAQEGGRSFNRKNAFGPKAGVQWAFLPRTALVLDASYQLTRWDNNLIDTIDEEIETVAVADGNIVKVGGGLRGRVTDKLILVIIGGYGVGTFDDETIGGVADAELTAEGAGADTMGLDRLLVDAQIRFEPNEEDRITLGYEKNFREVFFTNFAAYQQAYLRGSSRFASRFGASGEVGVRQEAYRGLLERKDLFVETRADLAYYVQDWATVSAGALWTNRSSDDADVGYNDVGLHVITTVVY